MGNKFSGVLFHVKLHNALDYTWQNDSDACHKSCVSFLWFLVSFLVLTDTTVGLQCCREEKFK